ncbi:MAG: rRNA maturation RNase YbeY [Actinomycetota bacterium]
MNVDVSGTERGDINAGEIGDFASAVLEREGVDPESALSIAFIDEQEIARLNVEYMGKEGPTDVLSFPIEDARPNDPPRRSRGGPPLELGDIFICPAVVESHAASFGVSFRSELHLMVAHGVLHILGWDHQTETEAEAMETREVEHLATIGLERR